MQQPLFNIRLSLFSVLALCLAWSASTRTLAAEKPDLSPYLLDHADDLVQWQAWSESSLAQAKKENKLLLLSSGYLACRYCHVMKRESFEDAEIAAYINRHFVPVLIDREMMPVLDSQLLKFMEVLEQPQGWPLQIILTPDGDPLVGAVYQPADVFLKFLTKVQERWQDSPLKMNSIAKNTTRTIIKELSVAAFTVNETLAEKFLQGLQQQIFLVADMEYGGFGDDSKYPMAPQLAALLNLYVLSADIRLAQILSKTLNAMAEGALHDAVNGGFFRYTTAGNWAYPHYEKMLDTNVQLASIYLQAADVLQQPLYRVIAGKTLDMLIEDFALAGGGFASSLAAIDSSGRDGGAYLWKESELKASFRTEEFKRISRRWQRVLSGDGVGYLPVIGAIDLLDETATDYSFWQGIFARLRQIGSNNKPARDQKLVTATQGLALAAFSSYGREDPSSRYRSVALQLFDLFRQELWQADTLLHSNLGGDGNLADYAYMADGLREYYEMSGDKQALAWSTRLVRIAWRKFYLDGFWRSQEKLDQLLPYTVYPVTLQDTELPSASATLIRVTDELRPHIDSRLSTLAEQARRNADATMAQSPFFYATQILVLINRQ